MCQMRMRFRFFWPCGYRNLLPVVPQIVTPVLIIGTGILQLLRITDITENEYQSHMIPWVYFTPQYHLR